MKAKVIAVLSGLVLLFTACSGGSSYPNTGDGGIDSKLEPLWTECEKTGGGACDELFFLSPWGSEAEAFGDTCGNRQAPNGGLCGQGEVMGLDSGLDSDSGTFISNEQFLETLNLVIIPEIDEVCYQVSQIGSEQWISSFREGFEIVGGEWSNDFTSILLDTFDQHC